MARHTCITHKVRTAFGNMYYHFDFDDTGRPVGGWISNPGKGPDSQIHKLIEDLSYGLNEALKRKE